MNTTANSQSIFQTIRGNCPATGRSASVCLDQTHVACYRGARESAELDRKLEQALRDADPSY